MSRPLMQQSIVQLNSLFSTSQTDSAVLKQLHYELKFRKVPRALELFEKVERALKACAGEAAPVIQPKVEQSAILRVVRSPVALEKQPELWSSDPALRPANANAKPEIATTVRPTTPQAVLVEMSVNEAYRLLQANQNSTWESIEITRRNLVQTSSPERLSGMSDIKRTEALTETRKVNSAYAILQQLRLQQL